MIQVNNTWNGVCAYARIAGARYPDVVAAQWALESGFGKHTSGRHNYFGLKGVGSNHQTKEFINGEWIEIEDGFLDFPSLSSCIDYLVDKWYKDYKWFKGVNHAPNRFRCCRMLYDQGYASDPEYHIKLMNLIKRHGGKKMALIGPKRSVWDYGFTKDDHHIIVNDANETAKCFASNGDLLWQLPALARGQGSDYEWNVTNTDTPPGLYLVGKIYEDFAEVGSEPEYNRTLMSYGWYSFDLVDLEGQETGIGRSGIMLHGGGSACGWPGAWEPMQGLYSTHGCIRMHNIHLREAVLPLTRKGKVFISVYQEGV